MPNPGGLTIRVLIVDDIAETRENIRKLLQFEPDMEVVGMARSGREGIALAKGHKPHVVLMDINMPDMDGIQATEIIAKEVPTAQIVIVSVQSDTDYLRRAMLAGARDFLSKPPAASEMINTIRRLGQLAAQREQTAAAQRVMAAPGSPAGQGLGGKVLVVYSPKGGTGCTVLATNLALALQSAETPVVIVDANLQFGDVGVCLNLQGKYSLVSLAERADELDAEFLQSVLVAHASGVKVLLAPPTPEDAELVTPERLKKVIHRLTDEFHYVVVDTSSALRDVELAAFDAADRLVLVATPDIPTLANVKKFFDLVEKLEYPPEKLVLMVNRVDRRGGISAANVEETLKHSVRGQVALDEKTVLASVNSGVPFVSGQKSLPPVQGVLDLARLIKDEFTPKEVPADDKGRKPATRMAGLFQRR